jgi:hypothetical protein
MDDEVNKIVCNMYFNRHVRDKMAVDGGPRSKFSSFSEMMAQVPSENVVKYRDIFVEYCKTIEAMEYYAAAGEAAGAAVGSAGWRDKWVELYRKVLVFGIEMAKLDGSTIDQIIALKDAEAEIKRELANAS